MKINFWATVGVLGLLMAGAEADGFAIQVAVSSAGVGLYVLAGWRLYNNLKRRE